MKYKGYKTISAIVIISGLLLVNNTINAQSNNNEVEKKDKYLITIEELNKDYFRNYWEIEKVVVSKLEKEGSGYFIENNCYEILGSFESTLEVYCQICEQLNVDNQGELVGAYLHLNDVENVKRQYERMINKNDKTAFIYQEWHKYKDSGETLRSKYLSVKYDERVEEFANAFYEHADDMEAFMIQEWDGLLPPIIRVILLNHSGSGPYSPGLNETYMPVKSFPKSGSRGIAGAIVHETFHLTNYNLLGQKCTFEIYWGMNSFKFLDEGYAYFIQGKFMNRLSDDRERVDEYSKNLVLANTFDFKKLKTDWIELFSSRDIGITSLAHSFTFFLIDKYGEEKLKALFLPTENISENSWLEYVENYFGVTIDDLIEEWKQKLII